MRSLRLEEENPRPVWLKQLSGLFLLLLPLLSRLGKLAKLPTESQDLVLAAASCICPAANKERKRQKTTVGIRVFKKDRMTVSVILEDVRSLGLGEIPALDADVCPDVFPLM